MTKELIVISYKLIKSQLASPGFRHNHMSPGTFTVSVITFSQFQLTAENCKSVREKSLQFRENKRKIVKNLLGTCCVYAVNYD